MDRIAEWLCLQSKPANIKSILGLPSLISSCCRYYIYCPSSAVYTCPLGMSDGAASVIRNQLAYGKNTQEQRDTLKSAYERLTSRDPAKVWTSGTL